ncbi:MAG: SCP2 sterol-binding domain-containing protein [Deltaproteobacteria bacterium]|nr:SCP2 sterol-binding domain-containing protein [Deltaproteobacteria bacterium]
MPVNFFRFKRGYHSKSVSTKEKTHEAANPDLTIETPFDVWMDILTRKADGAQMLMEGKYTVEGKTDLLLQMGNFFGEG